MNDIYKKIKEYNPNKKSKTLTVFNDIIADMLCNKRRYPTVAELFARGRKLNISYVFITQSYFAIPKNIRVIPMHFFIMKISTKENFNKLHLIIYQILTFKTL